jgi:Tfp pilus assembly protein PilW
MRIRSGQQKNGYSLIELVVYIAIFIALSLLLVQSLITAVKVYAASVGTRALASNGDLVLDRLTREVRAATSVSGGTFGITPSTITLSGKDANGAARTVTFSVANGAIDISDNGAVAVLTGSSVTVTNFTATHFTNANSDALRIALTLTTTSGTPQSATFYTTVLTRGK